MVGVIIRQAPFFPAIDTGRYAAAQIGTFLLAGYFETSAFSYPSGRKDILRASMRVMATILLMVPCCALAQTSPGYSGSAACKTCHPAVYNRWSKTLMANVVRDPKTHPDAIIPDPAVACR
jgi:hypothetical protein